MARLGNLRIAKELIGQTKTNDAFKRNKKRNWEINKLFTDLVLTDAKIQVFNNES